MSLSIGRAGLEGGRIEPDSISIEDEVLKIEGTITVALEGEPIQDLIACRDQLAGYSTNVDERWTVLRWPEEPELEGIYAVASISVDMSSEAIVEGAVEFSAELVQTTASRSGPATEILTIGNGRMHWTVVAADEVEADEVDPVEADAPSPTAIVMAPYNDGEPLQGVPYEARQYFGGWNYAPDVSDIAETGIVRWTDDGVLGFGRVRMHYLASYAFATSARLTIPPAAWYEGACRVTYLDEIGVRRTLVGTTLPATADLDSVRVENGIFRARMSSPVEDEGGGALTAEGRLAPEDPLDPFTTAGGRIVTEMFVKADDTDPGEWDLHRWMLTELTNLPFYNDASATLDDQVAQFRDVRAVTVIRNGPEQATIRVMFDLFPFGDGGLPEFTVTDRSTIDLTIRRGQMFVECRWLTDVSTIKSVQYEITSPPSPATIIDGAWVGHPVYGLSALTRWAVLTGEYCGDETGTTKVDLINPQQGFTFGLGHVLKDGVYGFDQGAVTVTEGGDDWTMAAPVPLNTDAGEIFAQYMGAIAEQQQVVGQ